MHAQLAAEEAEAVLEARRANEVRRQWLEKWGGVMPTDEERAELIEQGVDPAALEPPPKPRPGSIGGDVFGGARSAKKKRPGSKGSSGSSSRPTTPAALMLQRRQHAQEQERRDTLMAIPEEGWGFAPPVAPLIGLGRVAARRQSVNFGGGRRTSVAIQPGSGLLDGHRRVGPRPASTGGLGVLLGGPGSPASAVGGRRRDGRRKGVGGGGSGGASPLAGARVRAGRRGAMASVASTATGRARLVGKERQVRSAGGKRNPVVHAAAAEGAAVPTDVLAQCMRVARSYPTERFDEVLAAELGKASAAAEAERHVKRTAALLKEWSVAGKAKWEYAQDGLPEDAGSWDSSQVRAKRHI